MLWLEANQIERGCRGRDRYVVFFVVDVSNWWPVGLKGILGVDAVPQTRIKQSASCLATRRLHCITVSNDTINRSVKVPAHIFLPQNMSKIGDY